MGFAAACAVSLAGSASYVTLIVAVNRAPTVIVGGQSRVTRSRGAPGLGDVSSRDRSGWSGRGEMFLLSLSRTHRSR